MQKQINASRFVRILLTIQALGLRIEKKLSTFVENADIGVVSFVETNKSFHKIEVI